MALSFIKMLNSGLLHLTGGFIVYYAWVLTISLRCDNSCGKMIIMEMKLSEHYVMWANESMFSFVRFSLANWLRCETKFNGQPLRNDSSVTNFFAGINLRFRQTFGCSFHDQYFSSHKIFLQETIWSFNM